MYELTHRQPSMPLANKSKLKDLETTINLQEMLVELIERNIEYLAELDIALDAVDSSHRPATANIEVGGRSRLKTPDNITHIHKVRG